MKILLASDSIKSPMRSTFVIIIFIVVIIIFTLTGCKTFTKLDEVENSNSVAPLFQNENFVNLSNMDKLTISFAGDVLLGGNVGKSLINTDVPKVLADAADNLGQADLAMINLENPMSNRGEKDSNKLYSFRADPDSINILKILGVDLVTLANNHILDYGVDAVKDTMDQLMNNNIFYGGVGQNLIDAYKPIVIKKNGYNVAFVCATRVIPNVSWYAKDKKYGVAGCYDPAIIISQIKEVKKSVDFVFAYIHWGNEKEEVPINNQRLLAKKLIDEGCDAVVGAHPHVLQGIEIYKEKIIAYSLGNFIFTDLSKDTMSINFEFENKKIHKVNIIPYSIHNYFPQIITEKKKKEEFYKKLNDISFGTNISEDGIIKLENVRK